MINKKTKKGTPALSLQLITKRKSLSKPKRSAPVRPRNHPNYSNKFASCKRSTPALPLEFSKLSLSKSKRSQEEMIGFALIIILVAVILLVFLAISLNKPKTETESYEVNSFLQSTLQYTTSCQTFSGNKEFKSVQNLVFECELENKCSNGEESCKILNETLTELLKESWQIGEDRPNKGYELIINTEENLILNIQEGNLTKNCRGSSQSFSKSRTKKNFFINFEVCS